MKRTASVILACIMLAATLSNTAFAFEKKASYALSSAEEIDALKSDANNEQAKGGHTENESVRIMVCAAGAPALKRAGNVKSAEKYQQQLEKTQDKAISKIEEATGKKLQNVERYSLLFNGFAFDGTAADIDAINAMSGLMAFASPEFSIPEIQMSSSAETVGAPYAWDEDYSGEGTAIAIIDTGIRLSHEAFSVIPQNIKYDKNAISSVVNANSSYLHAGLNVSGLYKSDKIPFAYNYEFSSYDPSHTAKDHGTHVAAIAAGNNGKDFKGIAYDAQLFVMQVFTSQGGAKWSTILKALEDCAYLGVDAVNMSLGSCAGSSTYADTNQQEVYGLISQAGILVSASAGNDASTAYGNSRNEMQLAMNPDDGLVGSPSTYFPCLSVASSDNRHSSGYIKAYDSVITYNQHNVAAESFDNMSGSYDYVYCGLGKESEIPASVSGKIALVKRGELTFTSKAENAANAGARAIIVYNNVGGCITGINVQSDIPFATISDADGEFLTENSVNGEGKLEICIGEVSAENEHISDFSSRGPTADLKLKPEITAPGGDITSAIGFGNDRSYDTWSGTSMAAPHVAGGMAIVKSYVKEKMPNLSDVQQANAVIAILMGTATPLKSEMVSAQGAGIMNLEQALSSNVYITVGGERPKIELDDSTDCKWEYSLEITNFGTESVEYKIENNFMILKPYANDISGDPNIYVTKGTPLDVSELVDAEGQASVKVEKGETVTLNFAIDAAKVMDKYGECFPTGAKLEGYVSFVSQNEKQSVPILGFMGDWDYSSMFDRGFYWQQFTGETNLSINSSLPYNKALTNNSMGVGLNPYAPTASFEKFNPDWGAVSPNGDGVCDSIKSIALSILRNTADFSVTVKTPYKEISIYQDSSYGFKKDYYNYSNKEYTYAEFSIGYSGNYMYEGQTSYIKVTAKLDHDGYDLQSNELGQWVIPVTLDTVAPSVYVDDGKIAVYDEHYVAYTKVYADSACTKLLDKKAYYGEKRGETVYIGGYTGTVYVFAGDYAANGKVYAVDLDTGKVSDTMVKGSYFEEDPTGWSCDTNSSEWSRTDTETAYEGNGCISTSVEGAKITSPQISIPESDSAYAKLFVRAAKDTADYSIRLDDASETVLAEGSADSEWSCVDIDLSQYSGQNIKLEIVAEKLGEQNAFMADMFEAYANKTDAHMLVYKADGEVLSQKRIKTGDETYIPEEPTKEGYRFIGWDAEIPETMPNHDVVVNAVFERNAYTVTFADYDGTIIDTQTVNYGESAKAPQDPQREGYTFTGWDKDFTYIKEDTTVTAQYAINTYTVIFADYDGTVIDAQTVNYGESAKAPQDPQREGYVFTGWDKDFTCVRSDMKITAQYEVVLPDFELGDVNRDGAVNTADAVTVLKQQAGIVEFSDEQNALADTNKDGVVNTADAVCILKYSAGIIQAF